MNRLQNILVITAVVSFSCGTPIVSEESSPPESDGLVLPDDGNTDDGNTDDGNTDDGNTDDGNTDDGNTDDGNTDDGNTDDGNTDPVEPKLLRFIVIGDQGTGGTSQYKVADQMKKKCDADGCDFVLLLGDNIYNAGVNGIDDPQWQEKFELPYAALDVPFYAVLGNHDYGGSGVPFLPKKYDEGGMGGEWHKGPYEVQYTAVSRKWKMPDTFYTMKHNDVCFMMLDTNSIFWDKTPYGNQRTWYDGALAAMQPCEWVFVAGHHCYTSNGKHGNAGAYEGIELPFDLGDKWAFFDGRHIKKFFDEVVKDSADVILAGHDHNRQWLEPNRTLGAEMIVSGAGAKTTKNEKRGNATFFEDFDTPGFLWIQIEGRTMTGQFYDENGKFEFERVVEK